MIPEFSDAGVSQAAVAVLTRYFQTASEKFKGWILNPPGSAAAREYRLARAMQLSQQTDVLIMQLKAHASGWVGKAIPAAMADGIARARLQAHQAGHLLSKPEQDVRAGNLIDHATAIVLARDAAGDLYKAADSMGGRAKSLLRQTAQQGLSEAKINEVLAGGVIEGNPAAATKALRDELEAVHGDKVQIVSKNGNPIEFDVKVYAELVAVTKTREASVTARHQRLEEQGIDLVAIIGRISTNFCSAFLGQVFSLSGRSDKYPSYSSLPGGGPPFHPRCSKSTRPYIEELASKRQEEDAEILPDSERLLGMDAAEAQKQFKALQIHAQVKERYAHTEKKLFG